jgi:O-antigen ligase
VSDIFDEDQAFGSGRADFYPLLLKNYFSSFHTSSKNFFLGFGSRSVEKIAGGYYAHSDWLQILYSYGLLGLFILLWLHVSIIILIWRGIKQRFAFVPALAMNYVIFSLLNIYSGMLFFPNSIYFGMFISLYYYSLLKNNKQIINTKNA